APELSQHRWTFVPDAVATYALLSLLDYGFSIMAFRLGAIETNPLLAWYQVHGLFAVVKVFSIVSVVLSGALFWSKKVIRGIVYAANLLMLAVFMYHLYYWFSFMAEFRK